MPASAASAPSPTRFELAVASTTAMLRRAVREQGIPITIDERIGERDAARLLMLHPDTLARRRAEGTAPPAYGLGLGRARVSYRLTDLAIFIEAARKSDNGAA
jgi:hypothetical protein